MDSASRLTRSRCKKKSHNEAITAKVLARRSERQSSSHLEQKEKKEGTGVVFMSKNNLHSAQPDADKFQQRSLRL